MEDLERALEAALEAEGGAEGGAHLGGLSSKGLSLKGPGLRGRCREPTRRSNGSEHLPSRPVLLKALQERPDLLCRIVEATPPPPRSSSRPATPPPLTLPPPPLSTPAPPTGSPRGEATSNQSPANVCPSFRGIQVLLPDYACFDYPLPNLPEACAARFRALADPRE